MTISMYALGFGLYIDSEKDTFLHPVSISNDILVLKRRDKKNSRCLIRSVP